MSSPGVGPAVFPPGVGTAAFSPGGGVGGWIIADTTGAGGVVLCMVAGAGSREGREVVGGRGGKGGANE